jgi:hypothetical protein
VPHEIAEGEVHIVQKVMTATSMMNPQPSRPLRLVAAGGNGIREQAQCDLP